MSNISRKAPRELVIVTHPALANFTEAPALNAHSDAVSSLSELVREQGGILRSLSGVNLSRLHAMSLGVPSARAARIQALSRYYRVYAPETTLDKLAKDLRNHSAVESVYVKPSPEPPIVLNTMLPRAAEPAADTTDFTPRQGYLEPAPGGVDARYAWTMPGGSGDGVSIIDIEGEWRFTHEDLLYNDGGVVGGTPPGDLGWRNHGTAVLGEFHGDRNLRGVTGICPNSNVRGYSVFNDGAASAIRAAADLLDPGDIMLIELHYPGPRFNFQSEDGQRGYIPAEWWPDNLEAILYATQKGILVVEAAGNGSEDLDDHLYDTSPPPPQGPFPASWSNPFRRTPIDSLAIMVGAGAPPPGTHSKDWGPDRSRLDFSNFGSRVDVQGWGREVTTCGYGDLQGGDSEDLWYTDQFSGTSSASPMIVGVLGAMQGVLRAAGRPLLTPASARNLLRGTGSPQQTGPSGGAEQRIGNRPDLQAMIRQLLTAAPNVLGAARSRPST